MFFVLANSGLKKWTLKFLQNVIKFIIESVSKSEE
jgi:hypothetical protein